MNYHYHLIPKILIPKISKFYFTFFVLIAIMFPFNIKLNAENLNLTYKDHTKVMKFTLQHQSDIVKWMKNRNIRKEPSNNETLQFLAKLSDTRATYDIHLTIAKCININNRNRSKKLSRNLNRKVNSTISKVKSAKNMQQLKSLLSNEISKTKNKNDSLVVGIKIAHQILQDGIQHNIYSTNMLRKHSPRRGFWSDVADEVLDHAKDDAIGAIVGGFIGAVPGAIAGAIEESTGSLAGNILHNLLENPTPAY